MVYRDSKQLYASLSVLFDRIKDDIPATQAVQEARLLIRLNCTLPSAQVTINGRRTPVQIVYGPSVLRPDLDVDLTADALHRILLAELPLRKAISSGEMKVRGPVWKTPALESILHRGQALYPVVLQEQGLA